MPLYKAQVESSGIIIPTDIRTTANDSDYILAIDATTQQLYRITKADLLTGLSGGGGTTYPTSFVYVPSQATIDSGGAITFVTDSVYATTGSIGYQSSHSNGDSFEFTKSLTLGTYSLSLITNTGTQFAEVQMSIDGTNIFTVDLYGTSLAQNVVFTESFTIASSGSHTFKWTVIGHNTNSSDYYFSVQQISATKTG